MLLSSAPVFHVFFPYNSNINNIAIRDTSIRFNFLLLSIQIVTMIHREFFSSNHAALISERVDYAMNLERNCAFYEGTFHLFV